MTALFPVEQLNRLPRADFINALQPLFEAAGPLGATLYGERPFASYAALLDAAEDAAARLSRAEQVEIVNAHPRIGEDAALVRQASELSYREQGYAAENPAEVAGVYEQLRVLNQQYEDRFGFRFVVFVNQRPKAAIVDVMRERLSGSVEDELQTALSEMIRIARDRLRTLS